MSLFNKPLITFLVMLNLLLIILTKNVSAQTDSTDTPCPATLLVAILEDDYEMVNLLLEQGVDPNTSLENCHFEITGGQFKLQVSNANGEEDYIDAFEIFWVDRFTLLNKLNYWLNPWVDLRREIRYLSTDLSLLHIAALYSTDLSLLHIAALYHLHIHDAFNTQPLFVYRFLVEHGANQDTTDIFGRTPRSIMASKKRYTHLRP